jgi:hypothetical protein
MQSLYHDLDEGDRYDEVKGGYFWLRPATISAVISSWIGAARRHHFRP